MYAPERHAMVHQSEKPNFHGTLRLVLFGQEMPFLVAKGCGSMVQVPTHKLCHLTGCEAERLILWRLPQMHQIAPRARFSSDRDV
eukprot:CAMPEP_0172804328 /NCGR_PEP_ID=MMETSP1075-20121228/5097_1 /TAXON_ID=2916 /ORGANISM="Ceratium fusus, Strain PA161109" /LENGTH=84 /DNA_ID=CAMNT_0013642891 /DNA_START=300 /DNA_END=554 /DNA_ORIENTATION=+